MHEKVLIEKVNILHPTFAFLAFFSLSFCLFGGFFQQDLAYYSMTFSLLSSKVFGCSLPFFFQSSTECISSPFQMMFLQLRLKFMVS